MFTEYFNRINMFMGGDRYGRIKFRKKAKRF